MPELPEVETIRQGIIDKLKGKTIKEVEVRTAKSLIGDKGKIIGAKILDAKRVAKILEIVLNNGYSIVIHLKLTGQLIFIPTSSNQQPISPFVRIIYTFTDGSHLYFNDLRKFGWNKIVKTDEVPSLLGPDKFGPEPFDLRSGQASKEFTAEYLKKVFAKTSKKIVQVLMDQSKISGIGNIYANEALYYAGVLPTRPAKSLSDGEIKKLKDSIEKVINLGLKSGGSSENTYVNIEGKKGRYMDIAVVYQKQKDPKGHILKRQKINGRTAHFCPACQR